MLLQHAIDGIVATFYTQVMFADYELQAHRLVEEGQPVTADVLGEIYFDLFKAYHGDAIDYDELYARHLGAHPALLQHAVLRLPVRHLLRVERAAHEADDERRRQAISAAARRPLSHAAQVGRQRSSDGAAAARRRRSQPARNGAGGRRSAGYAGDTAREGDHVRNLKFLRADFRCQIASGFWPDMRRRP